MSVVPPVVESESDVQDFLYLQTALVVELLKKKNQVQRIIISNSWMLELKSLVKEDVTDGRGSLLISCYLEAGLFIPLMSRWQFKSNRYEKMNNILST